MKTKELNRYLISRLSRAEYVIQNREAEIDELTEKSAGLFQLLDMNQSILLWALNQIATETEGKVREVRIPMSEVYEICKHFATTTHKDGDEFVIQLEPKE